MTKIFLSCTISVGLAPLANYCNSYQILTVFFFVSDYTTSPEFQDVVFSVGNLNNTMECINVTIVDDDRLTRVLPLK